MPRRVSLPDQSSAHTRASSISPTIAARLPGLRKYVQHHAVPGPDGSEPAFDGLAEMWWADAEAMGESLASTEGEAAQADVPNFLDPERMHVFAVEQVSIV